MRKKNTNAGISSRSHGSRAVQLDHQRDEIAPFALRRRDEPRQRIVGVLDVGVGEPPIRRAARRPARAAATPSAIAHTLPLQPSGRGRARWIDARSVAPARAMAALRDFARRVVVAAIVDHRDAKRPG